MAPHPKRRNSALERRIERAEHHNSILLESLNRQEPRSWERLADISIKLGKATPKAMQEILIKKSMATLRREDAKIVMPLIWPALKISQNERTKVRDAKRIMRPLLQSLEDAYSTATENKPHLQQEAHEGKNPFDAYMDDAQLYLKEAQRSLLAKGIRGDIKNLPTLFFKTMERIKQIRMRKMK